MKTIIPIFLILFIILLFYKMSNPASSNIVNSTLKYPLDSIVTSSKFGKRGNEWHNGVDFPAPIGTKVKSPADGKVVKIFNTVAGGKSLLVKHVNGWTTGYAHLSGYLVKTGDTVTQGQPIALVGNTGAHTTGAHLHFTLRKTDTLNTIDPLPHLQQ